MITGPSCGQENPPIAKFCLACAEPLPDRSHGLAEERKVVTVLFADLVGFTARAEKLDPEDVRAILTPYFARVRSEIEAFGGTVEKFIGDAVMAVFGAPVAHGDDPERAVRAALAMCAAVEELNRSDPELERRPQLVTLFGPAGIGKTRLASEFAELAGAGGARVIKGRSLPYGEVIPYGAFATQVKQVAKIFDTDEAATACKKLDRAVAELFEDEAQEASAHIAMLIGIGKGGDVGNRQTLFLSARRLVEALATDRPTVLVFEDIHWADAGMLDLLEVLASRVRDVPLLLLTLARPDLLERRPGWGGGLPGFTALPVEPLAEEHAKELAAQVLRHMHKARHESAEIGLIGEGNPLFIEELAASVAEDATGSTSELPTTIRGIVAARLDALPPGERAVLLDAAVVGKVFWTGALEG